MKILIVDDEQMALEDAKDVAEKVQPKAEIFGVNTCSRALEIAEREKPDVALLDIEMPGMNGLELAKRLKEIHDSINIIFVTAYSEYALEAFSVYASGYLMKPLQGEQLKHAFENLRYPVTYKKGILRVQCFGNFEVFYKDEPVAFARNRAKELFAYLVDRKGASVNTAELCSVLWEDSVKSEKNRHYLRNLVADLKKALHECEADDVFIYKRNQFAIDPGKIECDYYHFLRHDVAAINSYHGEYMKQYSWAEFSIPQFENLS